MTNKDGWIWTAMILQPDGQAAAKTAQGTPPPVRLETFPEGLSAQVMHTGPYAAEGPTIMKLHEFIAAQGYRPRGKHHEIYLGDPRRAKPEKLKTIIRQPVEKA